MIWSGGRHPEALAVLSASDHGLGRKPLYGLERLRPLPPKSSLDYL